jgi:hypothetical protein
MSFKGTVRMIVFRGAVVFLAALMLSATGAYAQDDAAPDFAPESDMPAEIRPQSDVSVRLDLATIIRIPEGTDTLAIGNPAIADVTAPRAGGFTVITGKSYGTTNMLALDRQGQVLHEMMINVKAPHAATVTVQRGFARETWSCLPRCEPTATLGDAPEYFGGSSGQVGSRNGMAKGN